MDRRAVRIELVEAGQAKHAELLRAVIACNRQLLSGLSDAEIEELRRLLTKLERNVRPP